MPIPKLYGKLAPWFHLLTSPKDYAEEAAFYRKTLLDVCTKRPKTLLELGSGGGNNASHMKKHFAMTLVDMSPRMLALSKSINPECEHKRGDMRSVRLRREFDAVFIHDAIMYMTPGDSAYVLVAATCHDASWMNIGHALVRCVALRTQVSTCSAPACAATIFRPASTVFFMCVRSRARSSDGRCAVSSGILR